MWKYVRFPNQTMALLSRDIKDFTSEGMVNLWRGFIIVLGPYVFRVAKSMSKLDIKEYLTKIYNVRVVRVNTANVLGRAKEEIQLRYFTYRKGISIHSLDHPKGTRLEKGLCVY